MPTTKATSTRAKQARVITDSNWDKILDRRDKLNDDVAEALREGSVTMAENLIEDRANLSRRLIKLHNMRERDAVAQYRRQLRELKLAQGIEETEQERDDTEQEEGVA